MDKKIEILNFEKEAALKYLQETIDANYLEMKKGNYLYARWIGASIVLWYTSQHARLGKQASSMLKWITKSLKR